MAAQTRRQERIHNMKTAEELFKEITASEALQKEFDAIGKGKLAEIGAFLKNHDCTASAEEFMAFLKKQKAPEGELDDDAAGVVAGGKWFLAWSNSGPITG